MTGLPARHARTKTIAFQAIGVALIGAFVFIAFLRPSEPEDLSRIDAPADGRVDKEPDPRGNGDAKKKTTDGRKKMKQAGPGGRSSGGRGALLAALAEVGSASAPGANDAGSVTSPEGGGPEGGGEDPPDSQYRDLVSTLMEEVGQPALFRGVDP